MTLSGFTLDEEMDLAREDVANGYFSTAMYLKKDLEAYVAELGILINLKRFRKEG
jgi:hypothetical protein